MKKKSSKAVRYNKWGYIFLIPFILVYVVFQLIPLFNTIYNSFFENYLSGLTQIGPNFVGLENYKTLFTQGDIWIYAKNTMILWIMCFVPQIILSLLLGAWSVSYTHLDVYKRQGYIKVADKTIRSY